jgi:rRNA maturation endonuclease Nob1
MFHIVFNEADVDVLKSAIELDASLQGEVIQIKDDYAVGPLKNIYLGEGIEARKGMVEGGIGWWRL